MSKEITIKAQYAGEAYSFSADLAEIDKKFLESLLAEKVVGSESKAFTVLRKSKRNKGYVELNTAEDYKSLKRSLEVKNHLKLKVTDVAEEDEVSAGEEVMDEKVVEQANNKESSAAGILPDPNEILATLSSLSSRLDEIQKTISETKKMKMRKHHHHRYSPPPPPPPFSEGESPEIFGVHRGIFCDVCNPNDCLAEIRGIRYNCTECDDYDLCEDCYKNGRSTQPHFSSHKMKEIKPTFYEKPIPVGFGPEDRELPGGFGRFKKFDEGFPPREGFGRGPPPSCARFGPFGPFGPREFGFHKSRFSPEECEAFGPGPGPWGPPPPPPPPPAPPAGEFGEGPHLNGMRGPGPRPEHVPGCHPRFAGGPPPPPPPPQKKNSWSYNKREIGNKDIYIDIPYNKKEYTPDLIALIEQFDTAEKLLELKTGYENYKKLLEVSKTSNVDELIALIQTKSGTEFSQDPNLQVKVFKRDQLLIFKLVNKSVKPTPKNLSLVYTSFTKEGSEIKFKLSIGPHSINCNGFKNLGFNIMSFSNSFQKDEFKNFKIDILDSNNELFVSGVCNDNSGVSNLTKANVDLIVYNDQETFVTPSNSSILDEKKEEKEEGEEQDESEVNDQATIVEKDDSDEEEDFNETSSSSTSSLTPDIININQDVVSTEENTDEDSLGSDYEILSNDGYFSD